MKWIELSSNKSKEHFNKLSKDENPNILDYENTYQELREDVCKIFDETLHELHIDKKMVNKVAYEVDYIFGIKLYKLLTNKKYNMKEYEASNDGIWRYLQLKVFPDLVYYRWGFNEERFYKQSNRLWLKDIWWYVHLAWKQDEELTREILKNNNTDTIVQIVERSGNYGYRVEVYKEILYKKYKQNIKDIKEFRKIMMLNTMRTKVIDPYMVEGGVPKYVEDLYNDAINK